MRKILALTAACSIMAFTTPPGEKAAYALFNKKGKSTHYKAMLKQLAGADIVLFGEFHDNPICHWLEYSVLTDLFVLKKDALVVGAEMFEADNQGALDSFLQGGYSEKEFSKAARLWPNHKTDYAPLVNYAKENKIPFIATNIPRRYASLVFKKGFGALDSLSDREKSWMAPLPMAYDSTLSCYREIFRATGGHGGPTLPMAQASKDATMAYFILKNRKAGQLFLHFNGTYHSDHFESIMWYLKKADPSLKIITISSVLAAEAGKLAAEEKGRADFILQIPESMTRTH